MRVHNHALENFICAGVFALAADCLGDYDRELAWRCAGAAEEDFGFAQERYRTHGMELPLPWEHTYSSSAALYYGEIVTAAARIWKVTEKEEYAAAAAEYGRKLLDCQEKDSSKTGMRGFFYRDETHQDIIHYNHQAREHVPATALVLLCRVLEHHPDKILWEEGIRLYGEYLKDLLGYASPYEMLPAGLYSETAENPDIFRLLHLQADYETEKDNHTLQVKAGTRVKPGYGVRQFPVWFSFRGNTAVMLSAAKGAAAVGGYLKDTFLMKAAAPRRTGCSARIRSDALLCTVQAEDISSFSPHFRVPVWDSCPWESRRTAIPISRTGPVATSLPTKKSGSRQLPNCLE